MTCRCLIFAIAAGLLFGQHEPGTGKLAPYLPTPESVVDRMLQFGRLRSGERMFDLGSGDGRIVIQAAQKYHALATGVEIDPDLCRRSKERIRVLGLTRSANIIEGDIMAQDYSAGDLLTVYLLPSSNDLLAPLLERQLRKGTRVVAHDFGFSTWTPSETLDIDDDGRGRSHQLYLYQR